MMGRARCACLVMVLVVALLAAGSAQAQQAPKVVTMVPASGATDVDPGLTELRVTFDQDMAGGFSWTGGGETYPKTTGRPHWVDRRTCVLPVALEPGRSYQLGINSPSHKNFKSASGVPVAWVRWRFSTRVGGAASPSATAAPEGQAPAPSAGAPSKAMDRDYLIGWFKVTTSDRLIPVFKRDGTYYSVCKGFEGPLKECAEGLSGMDGTTIGFDEASNSYYIAPIVFGQSDLRDGFWGIGEKEPMTRINEPSGVLDPTTPAPRTNDGFLGWYQPVWFPWWRFQVRKEGERYLLVEQEVDGPKEAPVWKSRREPSEPTPLPEQLGFAFGPGGNYSLTYNDALKCFEVTRPKSPGIRMPLARIPAPSSPEGGPVPEVKALIGFPWY